MTTIAIIGAGKGLGAAVARRFGREGFDIALISRDQSKLDALAADLTAEGLTAKGFAANVRDRESLAAALDAAAAALSPIEVLQYSPLPAPEYMQDLLDSTVDDLIAPIEFSLFGPVTAVRQVLPGMRELGRGTILFINGGSAVRPRPNLAGTSVAFHAESAYGTMLHEALADDGIHAAQLIIPGAIKVGDGTNDPEAIADTLWGIHTQRGDFRTFTRGMDD